MVWYNKCCVYFIYKLNCMYTYNVPYKNISKQLISWQHSRTNKIYSFSISVLIVILFWSSFIFWYTFYTLNWNRLTHVFFCERNEKFSGIWVEVVKTKTIFVISRSYPTPLQFQRMVFLNPIFQTLWIRNKSILKNIRGRLVL